MSKIPIFIIATILLCSFAYALNSTIFYYGDMGTITDAGANNQVLRSIIDSTVFNVSYVEYIRIQFCRGTGAKEYQFTGDPYIAPVKEKDLLKVEYDNRSFIEFGGSGTSPHLQPGTNCAWSDWINYNLTKKQNHSVSLIVSGSYGDPTSVQSTTGADYSYYTTTDTAIRMTDDDWTGDAGVTASTSTKNGLVMIEAVLILEPPFIPNSPIDGARDNVLPDFNMSCSSGFHTLYLDENNPPVRKVLDNSVTGNWSANFTESGTFYYIGSCDDGTTNSSILVFYYDIEPPGIVLNPNNEFNAGNFSTNDQYDSWLYLNITFTDNQQLYGYSINVTHPNRTMMFYTDNLSISGTSFDYFNKTDISTWTESRYNISIYVADSHTGYAIESYAISEKVGELEFTTAEGNYIEVLSDSATTSTDKQIDRYNFRYDFTDGLTSNRTFNITATKTIRYINATNLTKHFAIFNSWSEGGNWIDFEGYGEYTVTKINDYKWQVHFINLPDDVTFRSIGGLNIRNRAFSWYRGNANPVFNRTLRLIPTNISVNASFDSRTMSGITARLTYNNSKKSAPTETIKGIWHIFRNLISSPDVAVSKNVTFIWNVTSYQKDGNQSSHIFATNQTVDFWGLDNCSLYSAGAFNFTVRDEQTDDILRANITFNFEYWYNPNFKATYSIQMKNRTYYQFCKTPSTVTLYGDMTHTVTNSGYETRTYYGFAQQLTGTFTSYLLKSLATVSQITYTIKDSTLANIENALMRFYRLINNVKTLVYQQKSDFAGQVVLYQDTGYLYNVEINASGYPFKTFYLQPTSIAYTIILEGTGIGILGNYPYTGIRFKVIPPTSMWNISNDYTPLTLYLEGDNVVEYGINLTNHHYECIPSSCSNIGYVAGGGNITVQIKLNETGKFWTELWFKREGESRIYLNSYPNDAVVFYTATHSLVQLLNDFKSETSPTTRTILVGIVMAIAVLISASLGIAGMGLMAVVVILTLLFSLPSMPSVGFEGIEFIHPLTGMFMAIVGIAIWIFTERFT